MGSMGITLLLVLLWTLLLVLLLVSLGVLQLQDVGMARCLRENMGLLYENKDLLRRLI